MEQLGITVTTMTDGTRTTAEAVMVNSEWERSRGTGSAGRERGDKFNASVGEDLAVARALRSLAAHLERRARGRVNHAESIKAHKAEIAQRNAEEINGKLLDTMARLPMPWSEQYTPGGVPLKPPHDF